MNKNKNWKKKFFKQNEFNGIAQSPEKIDK